VPRTAAVLLAAALSLLVTTVPAHAATATATTTQSAAALDSYWTPQRLAAAKPMPGPQAGQSTAPEQVGEPKFVHSTRSSGFQPSSSVWSTIGRLVFTVPGKGDYLCSANVVTSNNHDVIATARHCVMDIGTGQTYSNFRFAPGYSQGNAPNGWWNWRSMGWRIDDTSPGGDNAFIVLSTGGNNNRHVQDAIGSSGIGFNQPSHNYAHGIGIPADKDYTVWCEGQPYDGPQGGVQIPNCVGLSGGASGGAFIVDYQGDGSAMQTGSFFGSWGDSYFAYYRDAAWQVYNGAQNA
jgi:V8-like Glu-specific endopeptidase